jgi:hypothetical protein
VQQKSTTSSGKEIGTRPLGRMALLYQPSTLLNWSYEGERLNKQVQIQWYDEPEDHDYPAAESYLSLLYDEKTAAAYVARLKRAPVSQFKAKDIFRASGLSLLGVSNSHVEKDRKKIHDGRKLSPLLLVRGNGQGRLIIADGYHRLCAVYSLDEDAMIPCKIV